MSRCIPAGPLGVNRRASQQAMELYQLRYFVETARQRNFTQAARRLGLATAALSAQIQKLEAELGTELFVRGQRQSLLTPAGETLFAKAQELLSLAESAKQAVAEVSDLRAGRLTVAFVPALGTSWAPKVFQAFRQQFPCVKLTLEEDDSLGVAARVEDSSAELGVLELPVNSGLFEIETVWEEPVLAVLPPGHPLAGRSAIALAQLASEPFVVRRGDSAQETLAACRRAGFEPQVACECTDKETAIALVQAGLGVLLLPQLAAGLVPNGLAVIPISEPKLVRQFGLIRRRGRELSAAGKAFVELVRKTPFPTEPQPTPGLAERSASVQSPSPAAGAGTPSALDWSAPETLLSPLRFLERSARVYPQRPAVRFGQQAMTYGQFAQRVRQLASALRQAGLQPGDRVAWLCGNIPPMLEAHFGVPLAGGVLVPIHVRLTAGDIAWILDHSGARFLFLDAEYSPAVRLLRNHLQKPPRIIEIPGDRPTKPRVGDILYEEFLSSGSSKPTPWPLQDERALISLNYTSGTTGKPKGVMITHRNAYLNALGLIVELGLNSSSNLLWTLPMFHCNGWSLTWAATAVGATHTCLRRVDPTEVWRLMATDRVTHLCGPPTLLAQLLQAPERPQRLAGPLTVFVGGAPPSSQLILQWEQLGARVLHGYGLTETSGGYLISLTQPEWAGLSAAERAGLLCRQGVPMVIGETVRVVDDNLREVPADGQTVGEVIMRGATITPGYYKEPEATARDFRQGWFHTGDLAVVHPDGYIELRDRRRDIIIRDGEHISALEIEQTLAEHPAVAEVAVVGVPSRQHGETPKAFVVLKPGLKATPQTLIKFCHQRLASFKCPTQVELLPELPRTPSGKVQKFLLREKEWAGHPTRIHGV